MAHRKHWHVAQRYLYRCGYCGVSDVDTGGELTVDHFRPASSGGSDEDDNLVYCCVRCNQYKSDYWPEKEDVARVNRVLHPLLDDICAHIRINQLTGELEPLSRTGNFHILLLDLNRPQLVVYRQRVVMQAVSHELQQALKDENVALRQEVREYEHYVRQLEKRLRD